MVGEGPAGAKARGVFATSGPNRSRHPTIPRSVATRAPHPASIRLVFSTMNWSSSAGSRPIASIIPGTTERRYP